MAEEKKEQISSSTTKHSKKGIEGSQIVEGIRWNKIVLCVGWEQNESERFVWEKTATWNEMMWT